MQQSHTTINDNLIVVIMAGGVGKRMNSELPKVLHILYEEPMLVHVVKQAILLSPSKILIVVGKHMDLIVKTMSTFLGGNNKSIIQFVEQPEALGTGNAVQCCMDILSDQLGRSDATPLTTPSTTLILSGDVPLILSSTLQDFLDKHACNCNKATLMTTYLDNPRGYGRIIEHPTTGKFVKIVEERDCRFLNERNIKHVNGGIYVFNTATLLKYLPLLRNDTNSQHEYYLTDMIELIHINETETETISGLIGVYVVPREKQYQIMGVNTPEQLLEMEQNALLLRG